jgi:hypothetical protein
MASHKSDQVEVPPNHVMEGQGGSARSMDAPTFMWLNGYFVSIWTTNTCFTWR